MAVSVCHRRPREAAKMAGAGSCLAWPWQWQHSDGPVCAGPGSRRRVRRCQWHDALHLRPRRRRFVQERLQRPLRGQVAAARRSVRGRGPRTGQRGVCAAEPLIRLRRTDVGQANRTCEGIDFSPCARACSLTFPHTGSRYSPSGSRVWHPPSRTPCTPQAMPGWAPSAAVQACSGRVSKQSMTPDGSPPVRLLPGLNWGPWRTARSVFIRATIHSCPPSRWWSACRTLCGSRCLVCFFGRSTRSMRGPARSPGLPLASPDLLTASS